MNETFGTLELEPMVYPSPKFSDGDSEDAESGNTGNLDTSRQRKHVRTEPLASKTPLAAPIRRFKMLQQLEGIVIDMNADSVWAELYDLSVPSRPMEIVEIDKEQFSDDDLDSLQVGCVFYWCIGYDYGLSGRKQLVSELRIQRSPVWTQRKLDRVVSRAESISDFSERGNEI